MAVEDLGARGSNEAEKAGVNGQRAAPAEHTDAAEAQRANLGAGTAVGRSEAAEVSAAATAGLSAGWEVLASGRRVRDLEMAAARERARSGRFGAAARSEQLTAEVLAPLAERGWRILHDRRWPGQGTDTSWNVDHLLIGPYGVLVVDSKSWSGGVEIRDRRLHHNGADRTDKVVVLEEVTSRIEELVERIPLPGCGDGARWQVGLSPVHVMPIMVFTHGDHRSGTHARVGRVRCMDLPGLRRLLADAPRVLGVEAITALAEHLQAAMPGPFVPDPRAQDGQHSGPASNVTPGEVIVAVPARPEPLPDDPSPDSDSQQVEPRSAQVAGGAGGGAVFGDGAGALFDTAALTSELIEAAAHGPISQWMGFLHPSQSRLVRRRFNGPARVRGATGTGKTVVLLHRAAWFAATRPGRILVTTYVSSLLRAYADWYAALAPDTAHRVDFLGVHEVARQLLREAGQPVRVNQAQIEEAFDRAWGRCPHTTQLMAVQPRQRYWREEIDHVIKGRGLQTMAQYECTPRRGRGVALTESIRRAVWALLLAYNAELIDADIDDHNDTLSAAINLLAQRPLTPGWDAVFVDEVQDLSLLGIKLCAALAGTNASSAGADALFLAGDGQQALYPGGFTLAEAGVSVLGRSTVLRINYRNTPETLTSALNVLGNLEFYDLDADAERGARDVEVARASGQPPERERAPNLTRLIALLAHTLHRDRANGVRLGECAVLTRTNLDASHVRRILTRDGIPVRDLRRRGRATVSDDALPVDNVYRAKGMEFSTVYLISQPPPEPGRQHDEWTARAPYREFVARSRARDRLWIGTITPPRR